MFEFADIYDNESIYFRSESFPDAVFWLCDRAVAIPTFMKGDIYRPDFVRALVSAFDEQRRHFSRPDRTRLIGDGFRIYPFKFKLHLDFDECIIDIIEHPNMEPGEKNTLHFIKKEAHERMIKETQQQAVGELRAIVSEHVARGVETGVARAVQVEATTLKQVKAERVAIEAQKAELERKLAELNELEESIKEHERVMKERKRLPADPSGYVYLVKADNGYYKIGKAKDPNDRVGTFGVKLPFEIKLDHTIKCKNRHEAETHFHDKYADRRVKGEWFALTPEDVAEIKAIKEM